MLRRYLDRSLIMSILDRHTAAKFGGRALVICILMFVCVIIVAWWFQVFKFFLYDHWKPTAWVLGVALAWYVIGKALYEFERKTKAMRRSRAADHYGDDDCA